MNDSAWGAMWGAAGLFVLLMAFWFGVDEAELDVRLACEKAGRVVIDNRVYECKLVEP